MSEELIENYEANYLKIDHLSIDHAIKNEYPIISLFTPLNAQEAYSVLNTTLNDELFINYDLCCFLTIFIDAVSCLISNVSIEFGNQSDIYKLLKKMLHAVKSELYLNGIDSDKVENMLNIIKRSENRMKHTQFAWIMEQISIAFYNFHRKLKFFEEKQNPVDNFNGCNSANLTVVKRSSIKEKNISQYFIKNDNFMEDIKQISIDPENKMTMDQDEIIENKENLKERSGNVNELHPLAGKIFVRTDLGGTNIIPAVQKKRNAFDVLMRKKK